VIWHTYLPFSHNTKNLFMKKVFVLLAFAVSVAGATASAQDQTTVKQKVDGPNHKSKVKPTSTAGEKVHNVFSKHKRHSGVKSKGKNKNTNAKSKVEIKTKG